MSQESHFHIIRNLNELFVTESILYAVAHKVTVVTYKFILKGLVHKSPGLEPDPRHQHRVTFILK